MVEKINPASAEHNDDTYGIQLLLDELEPKDPELIGALKDARQAGVVMHGFYGETIAVSDRVGPDGVALSIRGLSDLPAPAKDGRPGVLEISAHDWTEGEDGKHVRVTGIISMDEEGRLLAPSVELTHPAHEDTRPGTEGHVTRTIRTVHGRPMVEEEREGEGDPLRIRAMAIDAARKIVERGQAPGTHDTPEAGAA